MQEKGQWSTKLGFILASAGAAIGLGAIWKMPYETGQNGGGAFFLLFVIFTLLIGLPMLIAEFLIGRSTQKEAVSAYKKLAPKSVTAWIGKLGVVGCFLLLSFYSVVGGWILLYTIKALTGTAISSTPPDVLFGQVTGSPSMTIIGVALFTLFNVLIISLGVQNGIEKANKFMMPLLFIFFIILVVRSLTLDGAMEGVRFFLQPDFTKITGEGVLYALGQSFFALAVGFSCMVTYSSYLKKEESLPSAASSVVIMNIVVSLLAGLAIFPAVFAGGFEPTYGPGLLFVVLPSVFGHMPFGEVFFAIFLLLFLFATLTSSFSLYEIIVAAVEEKVPNARKRITWVLGVVIFAAAIPAALSYSTLSDFTIFGQTIFDATDHLVSNILLPLGNLLIALFIVHKVDKKVIEKEFFSGSHISKTYYTIWRTLMTYVVPVVIAFVLYKGMF
ncbi:sodium-dependent transporter [Kurthia senegalensis]|uniref:sodium-dependent transporter n=1 Tax=Kurthia senegalensis TaxID=1033740 RepID=UPI0002883F87|nr:sodium-dependent transporter [Kurthia senegalensis]